MSTNYVVINRENMTFVAVADSMTKASLIAWNDCDQYASITLPLDLKREFSTFSVLELLLLYKNATGLIGDIHDFAGMMLKCYELALALPIDARTEAELQATCDKLPVIEIKTGKGQKMPIIHRFNEADNKPNPFVEAPKAPSSGNPSKPSPKGATGRVWEIADRLLAETLLPIGKELRTKIIAECEAAGIHPATAATQFSKWKASK